MLTLYYYKHSRASRVRWALEELEVPYELASPRDEQFAQANPLKLMPTLTDDGHHLFETGAILLYLGDKYGKLCPRPDDLLLRGQYYQWMFYAMTELDALTLNVYLSTRVHPDEAAATRAREKFASRARLLSDHLAQREYVVGDAFTMADLLIASVLGWSDTLKLLENFPDLQAYHKRLEARPAATRNV